MSMVLLISLTACNTGWDCVKSAGDWQQQTRPMPAAVNTIRTTDGVNITLTDNSVLEYQVEGGANLLSNLTADPVGPVLALKNGNGCNLARATPDQLLMRLPLRQGWQFFDLLGYGRLTNQDTLRGDTIRINQYGASQIDLTINTNWMITDLNGNGDFSLAGRTKYLQIFTALFNRFDATACAAETVYVYARGEHDITVRADKLLYVSMESTGSVIYVGNPVLIIDQKGGTGQIRRR